VVIPEAQPLPTPVTLSGDLEAARGFGVHIPWNPFLVLLVSIGILGGGGYWFYRQKPAALSPAETAAAEPSPAPAAQAAPVAVPVAVEEQPEEPGDEPAAARESAGSSETET
jgi:hypothetical protein